MLSIWIGHLGAYNAGRLIGQWADLPVSPEEAQEVEQELMEQAEDICEFGDEFEVMDISVHEDLKYLYNDLCEEGMKELNELALYFETMIGQGHTLRDFMLVYATIGDIEDTKLVIDNETHIILDDVYTEEDLGRAAIDELEVMQVPDHLEMYFDYEKLGITLMTEGWKINTDQGRAISTEI